MDNPGITSNPGLDPGVKYSYRLFPFLLNSEIAYLIDNLGVE